MARRRGPIIAIEGLSFTGKSTGIALLRTELAAQGISAQVVEWNAVPAIRFLTKWLHGRGLLHPVTYSLILWGLCLAVYWTRMRPALTRGDMVIADRYIHTALTRDGVNGPVTGRLSRLLYRFVPKPDGVLYFSLEPRLCLASMRQCQGRSLFHLAKRFRTAPSDLDYLEALREAYTRLLADPAWIRRPGRVIHLDGTGTHGRLDDWLSPPLLQRLDRHVRDYRKCLSQGIRPASPMGETQTIGTNAEGVLEMLFDRVCDVLREFAKTGISDVRLEHKLKDDLGIDSVDIVKIILAIEEAFGVEIDMASIRMESFRSVEGVLSLVEGVTSAQAVEA